jgi:hypothetical protein
VLQQRVDNAWQPLAFISKKLNPAQQKYNAYDRELLAIYEAVKHFRHMLEGSILPSSRTISQSPTPSSRNGINTRRGSSITSISSPNSPPTSDISLDKSTLSPTLTLVTNSSLLHRPTTQDTDDELRALLASNTALRLEKQQIPPPPSPSSATRLPENLDFTFKSLYASKCSSLSTICRAQALKQRPGIQKNCLTWARACQTFQRFKVSCHTI